MRENGGNEFASSLKPIITGRFAAISDQSDAYQVFRLMGPHLRAALCKLVPIDIHERAFKVGDVAETIAGHVGMLFWRLDDIAGVTGVRHRSGAKFLGQSASCAHPERGGI